MRFHKIRHILFLHTNNVVHWCFDLGFLIVHVFQVSHCITHVQVILYRYWYQMYTPIHQEKPCGNRSSQRAPYGW